MHRLPLAQCPTLPLSAAFDALPAPFGADGFADSTLPAPLTIRAADSHGHRSSANILIQRRYAWRGYSGATLPEQADPNRITLSACDHEETVGTITVGVDGPSGLHVEEVFADHVEQLRAEGRRLCEFTKLAMDTALDSQKALASLFHVAYLVASRVRGCDMLLIEVNPRHVAYYRRMLGCKVRQTARWNHRVGAPAVLLILDFAHTSAQLAKFGGQAEAAKAERSLYPFGFSPREESGILGRLRQDLSLRAPKSASNDETIGARAQALHA